MYNLDNARAISLTQPWATLVAIGAKQIETRSWQADHRGALLIHAAKSLKPIGDFGGLRMTVGSEPFYGALTSKLFPDESGDFIGSDRIAHALPRGRVVAVCNLISIVSSNALKAIDYWDVAQSDGRSYSWLLTLAERAFGDYSDGRRCWLLGDVVPLAEPIVASGARGLWTPTAATREAVAEQLAAQKAAA